MSAELLGIIIACLSLIIAFMGYQLNKQRQRLQADQHIKSESEKEAEVRTSLLYISRGVDDIKVDLKANEKVVAEISERVTRLEESTKQAHDRINEISPKK
ncbi:hypothetical protein MUN88_08860 [Gracilibacillus caseinilyticus]|uniref:Uncharacterized protein n=1 Tax=Gracilibacillus caseinilyticus TaxID=2932256 RepID=A0ABY4F1P2_9BACI|nr:hypothetical protein [Gracilibacillus caseinilyticus]UOQ50146.1 hypothetical protein MUN88_08860 [Gracilibacillus caseinilyticus]